MIFAQLYPEEKEARAFNREAIQQLLASFEELFQKDVKPYQRKVLLKWVLERIELSPKQLKVGLKLRPASPAISPLRETTGLSSNQPSARAACSL